MLTPSTSLPPITFGVHPQAYHSLGANIDRGDKRKVMSNSELKKFASCPSRWLRGQEKKETDSLEWGSILDCVLLTPDLFERTYAISPETYPEKGMKCPSCESVTDSAKCRKCKADRVEVVTEKPWNRNATFCSEWESEQESKGMIVAKPDLCSEAHLAKSRIMADPLLSRFIKDSDTQVQVCVDWRDPDTGIVVPLKCLLDLVPKKGTHFANMLADLKTACSGAPHAWAKAIFSNGYHMQAALYLDAYNLVTGEQRNVFGHVVQENFAPYEVARRILSDEYLQVGRDAYQQALSNYCQCLASNEWPGLDDADGMGQIIGGWRLVQPEAWMIMPE